MRTYFALEEIDGPMQFSCISTDEKKHKQYVNSAFYSTAGMKTKGSNYSFDDFMKPYRSVKITVERLP